MNDSYGPHRLPRCGPWEGIVICLGAALARTEGKVALEQIHLRLLNYEIDHSNKVRFHSSNVTGWNNLPITFTAS